MSQIKQLLLLKKNGVSNRKAAEIIGINKETVNNYMNKVNTDSLSIDELLRLDDSVLEHPFKDGNPAYSNKRFETFKHLPPSEEMKRKHVTLKLLWKEYRNEHPDNHYSLTQFSYHYNQNTKTGKEYLDNVFLSVTTGIEKCQVVIHIAVRYEYFNSNRIRFSLLFSVATSMAVIPSLFTAFTSGKRKSSKSSITFWRLLSRHDAAI